MVWHRPIEPTRLIKTWPKVRCCQRGGESMLSGGSSSTPRPDDTARALEFFSEHVLQHRLVQRQIRHDAFQPCISLAHLLELPYLIDLQPRVLLLPPIEGLFGDPHLPDQLRDRYAQFCLLQNGHDLFHSKPSLLHGKSHFSALDLAGN